MSGGTVLVWVIVVLVAGVAIASWRRGGIVTVDDQMTTTGPVDRVDQRLLSAATGLPGADVANVGPGQLTVSSTWTPTWVVLLAVLLFPVGLVLLLVRSKVELHVRTFADGSQVTVQVAGRSKKNVALSFGQRLQEAL